MKGGIVMFEGSLRVWEIILAVGVIVISLLGFFSRHALKEDKEKLKARRSGKKKGNEIDEEGAIVRLGARFNGITYLFFVMVIGASTFIAFCVEDFSNAAESLGGGTKGVVFTVVILLFVFLVMEIIMFVWPYVMEEKAITLLTDFYQKRYNTKVSIYNKTNTDEEDDLNKAKNSQDEQS